MTSSIWTVIVTVFIAIFVALMARQLKISEFRQGWIDGIRKDISEFISKAHEWIDLYMVFNEKENQKVKAELAPKLDRIKYDAFHVLWRIELRFKPNDTEANNLISSLKNLLNPGKLTPDNQYSSWRDLADSSVLEARNLLKEEWETTKNPFRKLLILCSQRCWPNKPFNRTP
jgi:hypothetical protein